MSSRIGILAASLVLGPWGVLAAQSAQQNAPQSAPRPNAGDRSRSTTARVANTRLNLGMAAVEAAQRGDLATVKSLLAQGADVTVARGDGMTALHWAADRGDVAMANALLRAGAKTDAKTNVGGYTPLHVASKAGAASVVKTLLDQGADARTMTGTGASALHLAASSGSADAVDALLKHKADPNVRETAWGQTPLMFAATQNRADVIRVLVKAGANPSVQSHSVNLSEELARQQAAAKKRNEVLLAALPEKLRDSITQAAAKAAAAANARNTFAPTPGAQASAAPMTQATPATPAAAGAVAPDTARGGGGAGALFVARGGSPTPPTSTLTSTQIQEAIRAGREVFDAPVVPKTPEQVELLEGNVAGYEGTVGSMGGMTALHHASRQGNIAAAMALIDGGAGIDTPTSTDSTTPLVMAAINGQFDLALELVKRGANVKLATTAGLTPLYAVLNTQWAPRSRFPQPQSVQTQQVTHIELMQAMLKSGANVNARLRKNLWFFAFNNCGNANCGLEQLEGTSPFWRAAYAVDVDAMRVLKAAGADDTMPSFRAPQAAGRGRGGAPGGGGGLAAALARGGGAGGPDGPGNPGIGPIDAATDSAMKAVAPGLGTYPIHSAAGVGYGNGFAGNSHRHAPDGWMPALKYLVEELHHDVNKRDLTGYSPLHHAAARGDNEMILYLLSKGADPKAVARNGRTTVDMANGPVQRLRPFPETILLLEKLGAKNSHRCVSC